MDIAKEYEQFKIDWCKKHNRPLFDDTQIKLKMLVWKEFMDTFLKDNYAQISQDYKNMKLKTVGDLKREMFEMEEVVEEETAAEETAVEETESVVEEQDDWDIIKKMMDEM